MKQKRIKFEYDREVDAAYLSLGSGPVDESDEVKPGLIVDFDASGNVVGVEILRFAGRFVSQVAQRPASGGRARPLKKSA